MEAGSHAPSLVRSVLRILPVVTRSELWARDSSTGTEAKKGSKLKQAVEQLEEMRNPSRRIAICVRIRGDRHKTSLTYFSWEEAGNCRPWNLWGTRRIRRRRRKASMEVKRPRAGRQASAPTSMGQKLEVGYNGCLNWKEGVSDGAQARIVRR